jgi:outer membrane protein OmpA-like peptidoglycan-associated protein
LPDSSGGLGSALPRIETATSTTGVSTGVAEVGSGEALGVPDLSDDRDAAPGEENDRPPVETIAGPAVEQFLAGLGSFDTPALDSGASGLEVVIQPVIDDLATPLQATRQPFGGRIALRQSAPGLTPETDEGSPLAQEKNAAPDRGESPPGTSVEAEPATAGVQSAGSRTHGDAALEQRVDEVTSDCAPLFPVRFKHGSVQPQVLDMNQKIEALAAWLTAHPTARLYLDGHADTSGPEDYNLVLSFRRADAVAELLKGAGTPKTQLVVRAYGEGQSLSPATDSALERRVDLTIDAGVPCEELSLKGGDGR